MKKVVSFIFILVLVFCVSGCGNSKTIKKDEPIKSESVEYTLHNVEFSKSINYTITDSYMGSDDSRTATEDNVFAIVKYSIKNIGKKSIPLLYSKVAGELRFTAVGRFVYGDGYTYENGFYNGKRPYAYLYNESPESANSYAIKDFLEPLTSQNDCITYFTIPKDIVENTDEKLVYEISFEDIGDKVILKFVIPDEDRVIIE